jgi:DNA processing protein
VPATPGAPAVGASSGLLDPRSPDAPHQRTIEGWLALQDAMCLSPVRAIRELDRGRGDPARVRVRSGDRPAPGPAVLRGWRETLARLGAVGLPHPGASYPDALRAIGDPPPLLWVRGDRTALYGPSVAIVGARAATGYGRGVARSLAAGLARCGVVVVSGLARGIDAAAHRGALEAGGRTVAVQACGPDVVYPPEHRSLAERITEAGAVVTELPPGRPPVAAHFPLRNRLISGLSLGVVVVEARPRSGSLITVRHALEQGREVWAVPGPVTAPTSAGPNALLRDGARPALELRDVIEALGLHVDPSPDPRPPDAGRALDREEARLLALLGTEPCTEEEILARLAWTPGELARRRVGLELDGLVVADRDGRLRAVRHGSS